MELLGGGDRRWRRGAVPLALFVLAFGVRALPYQGVLVEGRTLFFDNDAYYHMRRIMYSIVHFPRTLDFDPYINFPDGGQPIWSPLFDWTLAALLRPFWGRLGGSEIERLAVGVPPLLGAATVLALHALARRHFGRRVALLAGAILSVLSAHFWYSQVGFIDHHAAVALASTLVLAAAMGLIAKSAREPEGLRAGLADAVALGVALGLALLLWPGCLLHVGLVDLGLLAFLASRPHRAHAIAVAERLAVTHAVAFALLLPAGSASSWTAWERMSPVVLSAFQPWYTGSALLCFAGCAAIWRRGPAGSTRPQRWLSATILGAVVVLAGLAVFPSLPDSAGDAWKWFAKTDDFQGQVMESMPLLHDGEQFTLVIALARLSGFFLLVPAALVFGCYATRRDPGRASVLFFLWWTLGLSLATLMQRRFFNCASVATALLFALSIGWLRAVSAAKLKDRPLARRSAGVVLGAAVVALLAPVLASYAPYVSNLIQALRNEPPAISPYTHRQAVAVETANWIRVHSPEPSSWLDPAQRPAYGILAPWTIGHILEYEARRPAVTDNFGDDVGAKNFLLARRYYQSAEPAAAALLERLAVRYVVAQAAPNYLGEPPVPGSVFASLFTHDGSAFEPSPENRDAVALPALARHRLIYDSRPLARAQPPGDPLFKVFEFVAGASVEGSARPGARIEATLPVRSNRGRRFVYTARTNAAADGRYAFRLPYANDRELAGMRVAPHYTLACDGDRQIARVDEAAVRQGARIDGPDLCGASGASARSGADAQVPPQPTRRTM